MTATVRKSYDPFAGISPEGAPRAYADARRSHGQVVSSAKFGGWVVIGYAEAKAALGDSRLIAEPALERLEKLSRGGGPSLDNFKCLMSKVSFLMDGSRHASTRRFLSRVFQRLEIDRIPQLLAQRASGQLDKGRSAGGMDLVADYGRDLALFSLHALLGIPLAECHEMAAAARRIARYFDRAPRSIRELAEADQHAARLLDYFVELARRRLADPSSDGVSRMVSLAREEADVGERDLAGYLAFFFVAGEETTAAAIALSAAMLVERPALRAAVAKGPDAARAAAKEYLRLTSTFQYVSRVAAADLELGGRQVFRGNLVHIALGAANRDPAVFPDPDEFRLDRERQEALPFGLGPHRCLGANLATLELEAAILAIARAPEIRLEVPLHFEPLLRIPTITRAWVTFDASSAKLSP
jgi:hypothetical protein